MHDTKTPPKDRLSHALLALLDPVGEATGPEARISIGDLVTRMHSRAHPALLILFALPNTVPGIPGMSAVLGVPLVYLSVQQALGRPPWLPSLIARRSISRTTLETVLTRALPWLERGERYLHPRLTALASPRAERIVGAVSVLLALILMLPIPFGNMLPALAIICFALGVMEDDGVWVLAGAALAVLSVLVASTVIWAVVKSLVFVLVGVFS